MRDAVAVSRVAITLALASICAVTAPQRADARRVVHIPTLRELCPGGSDWVKVSGCIKRQGDFKLVRDEKAVKLVQLSRAARLGGLYVFMHDGKSWQLRGELRVDQDADLLRFERVAFGKHAGYRVDVGIAMNTSLSRDGETVVPAVLRQQFALLCFEDRASCLEVMTSCDLLVRGRAYNAFRGKLAYANKQLSVVGDRRRAGEYCEQPELVLDDQ